MLFAQQQQETKEVEERPGGHWSDKTNERDRKTNGLETVDKNEQIN